MKVMTESYAETKEENAQIVQSLQDQIKENEQLYNERIERATLEKEKEVQEMKVQMQNWDENHQNDIKQKHLDDQNKIKNLTQKNTALQEQIKDLKSKNDKLANIGTQLAELKKIQKEERKKFTELSTQLKESNEKLEKQTRLFAKGQ